MPKNTITLHFPKPYSQKTAKLWQHKWIYNKTQYVYVKRLPKHWKFCTHAVCDVCDILQVCTDDDVNTTYVDNYNNDHIDDKNVFVNWGS